MMMRRSRLLAGYFAGASALVFAVTVPAAAQDAGASGEKKGEDIVVSGIRAGLESSLHTKREASPTIACPANGFPKTPEVGWMGVWQKFPGADNPAPHKGN